MLDSAKELLLQYAGTGNIHTLIQRVGQDSCRLAIQVRSSFWPRTCFLYSEGRTCATS